MFRKLILSFIVFAALFGVGFGLAQKNEMLLARRIALYETALANNDFEQAYTRANQLAADGHMPAHGLLAQLYENGTGVAQNMTIALEQYKLASMSGDAQAQTNLARLYLSEEGGEKNIKLAVHWLEKAAAQNNAAAQYELGRFYQNGTLQTQDITKAKALLLSASENGVSAANPVLASIESSELGLR